MNHSLECKIELYKRKNYELLGLFEKQVEALAKLNDNITNELLYGGGARGGKSYLLGKWKVMNRLSMAGSHGLIAREENTKLKDTTLKTFFEVLDDMELVPGEDYIYHTGSQTFEFFNGSTEIFRELKYLPKKDPEFDRIGSYDLTDAALDEAQQIHWKAIDVLKGRFSSLSGFNTVIKNGIKTKEPWQTIPKAFYSCNPAKNWIHTDFYTPFKTGTLAERKAFVMALPTDNPYVSQAYIDNLKQADKITRERLLYGNFDYDDDPDSLCEWDAIVDIFNNEHVEPNKADKWLVTDLALMGRDKWVVMYFEGMVGHIEVVQDKAQAKEIEERLRGIKKEKNVANRRIIADSDGLGSYLASYIENIREFRGGSSPNEDLYDKLKDECGYALAKAINNSELRLICSDKETREAIKNEISICLKREVNVDNYKHRMIKKSVMKEKLGWSPDFLDTLIMRFMPVVEKNFDVLV